MKRLIALLAAAGIGSAASAEVIVSWINFGQPGNQDFSPVGTEAANVTGSVLTRGAGLSPAAGANSLNSSAWHTHDETDYVTFGFTADAGYWVDLDSLWFGSRSSNSGPGELGLFTSLDGFADPVYLFTQSGTTFNNQIVDLSGLTGLTGTVEFRIYAVSDKRADGGDGISSAGTFRVGDHFDGADFTEMRFIGTVVPAPASLALLTIGGMVAARRRRA